MKIRVVVGAFVNLDQKKTSALCKPTGFILASSLPILR